MSATLETLEDGTEIITTLAPGDEEPDIEGLESADHLALYATLAETMSHLTPQQRTYINAVMAGRSELDAAKIAGYAAPAEAVKRIRHSLKVKDANFLTFAGAGITPMKAAKRLASLMDATQTKHFSYQGKVIDQREVDDNKTRLEATQTYYKLSGQEPATKQQIDVAVSSVPAIPQDILDMDDASLLLMLQRRQHLINSGGG